MMLETFVTPRKDDTVIAYAGISPSKPNGTEYKFVRKEGRLLCLVEEEEHIGELMCATEQNGDDSFAAANIQDQEIAMNIREKYRQRKFSDLRKKADERRATLHRMRQAQGADEESALIYSNTYDTEGNPDAPMVEKVAVPQTRRSK